MRGVLVSINNDSYLFTVQILSDFSFRYKFSDLLGIILTAENSMQGTFLSSPSKLNRPKVLFGTPLATNHFIKNRYFPLLENSPMAYRTYIPFGEAAEVLENNVNNVLFPITINGVVQEPTFNSESVTTTANPTARINEADIFIPLDPHQEARVNNMVLSKWFALRPKITSRKFENDTEYTVPRASENVNSVPGKLSLSNTANLSNFSSPESQPQYFVSPTNNVQSVKNERAHISPIDEQLQEISSQNEMNETIKLTQRKQSPFAILLHHMVTHDQEIAQGEVTSEMFTEVNTSNNRQGEEHVSYAAQNIFALQNTSSLYFPTKPLSTAVLNRLNKIANPKRRKENRRHKFTENNMFDSKDNHNIRSAIETLLRNTAVNFDIKNPENDLYNPEPITGFQNLPNGKCVTHNKMETQGKYANKFKSLNILGLLHPSSGV